MSPHAKPSQGWEVSLSCDIQLKQVVDRHPEIASIEVKPEAISEILDALNPGSSGRLHFELVHDDRFINENCVTTQGLTSPAEEEDDGVHVEVSLGGGLDVIAFYPKLEERLHEKMRKNFETGEAATDVYEMSYEIAGLYEPEDLQITSVHELQHTADWYKKILNTTDTVLRSFFMPLAETGVNTAPLIGAVCTAALTNVLRRRNYKRTAGLTAIACIASACMATSERRAALSRTVGTPTHNWLYDHLPMEKRAIESEKHAHAYPHVIEIIYK